MSLTGLKVSKIIIKDSEKTIEDKLVVYNEAILKKCKEGFISLKNNKTILNEKFDDNIWK